MIDDISFQFVNLIIYHAVLYISGFIERRVLQKLSCNTCIQLLSNCKKATSHFIDLKSFGNLCYPREDTYRIASTTKKIFNIYRIENKLQIKHAFQRMTLHVIRNINIQNLFTDFDVHVLDNDLLENHKYEMIKTIIVLFKNKVILVWRKLYIKYIREDFTKIILFKEQ